jgi:hypothetical protein
LHAFGTKGKSEASSILVTPMPDLFGVTPLQQHGGKRPGAGRPRKGEVRPPKQNTPSTLNSRSSSRFDYIVRRLARDALLGCREAAILLAGVRDHRISAYAAGCEMNYCRRREPTGRGSPNASKRIDWAMHKLLTRPDPKALIG